MTETEKRWLNYAWSVINCPKSHREQCEALGAAVPGHGRVDGNEVRWPGYLGGGYRKGTGILCVGAVHREARPEDEACDSVTRRTNAELVNAHRCWVQRGRYNQLVMSESPSRYMVGVDVGGTQTTAQGRVLGEYRGQDSFRGCRRRFTWRATRAGTSM